MAGRVDDGGAQKNKSCDWEENQKKRSWWLWARFPTIEASRVFIGRTDEIEIRWGERLKRKNTMVIGRGQKLLHGGKTKRNHPAPRFVVQGKKSNFKR